MATIKAKQDISAAKSLPEERAVRGYTIRRMPIGRFIKAIQTLQGVPETILGTLFPDDDLSGISERLRTLDKAGLMQLFARALAALPETALALISELTDIPLDRLTDDPAIGLDGLMEIANAWLEVNRIENFFAAASALMQKSKALAAKTGAKS